MESRGTQTRHIERTLLGTTLALDAVIIGADASVTLSGGKPHIGCTVLSQARPSLTGDGSTSATTSIINVLGHKDDVACRMVAERLSKEMGGNVVCSGGFHLDSATPSQIEELMVVLEDAVRELLEP